MRLAYDIVLACAFSLAASAAPLSSDGCAFSSGADFGEACAEIKAESAAYGAWAGLLSKQSSEALAWRDDSRPLRWTIGIGSIRDAGDAPGAGVRAAFMLAPGEPSMLHMRVYGHVPAIVVIVDPLDDGTTHVSLYSRQCFAGYLGIGDALWVGRLRENAAGPFALTLELARDGYRVACDHPVATESGAPSGDWRLEADAWDAPVYIGAYAENTAADRRAALSLMEFSVSR